MQAVRSMLLGGLASFVANFLESFDSFFLVNASIAAGDDAAIRHHFLIYHCFVVYPVAADVTWAGSPIWCGTVVGIEGVFPTAIFVFP